MRNLARVDPKNRPKRKSLKADFHAKRQQWPEKSRVLIDEQQVLEKILELENNNTANKPKIVLPILLDIVDWFEQQQPKMRTDIDNGKQIDKTHLITAISDWIFGKVLALDSDERNTNICILRILSHLCHLGEKWIIKILQHNADLILLRALYVPEMSDLERSEALHLGATIFLKLSARNANTLLSQWWRFRLFAKEFVNFLIKISLMANTGDNSRQGESGDGKANLHRWQRFVPPCVSILFELCLRHPALLFDLQIGVGWLVPLMHKSFEDPQFPPVAGLGIQLLAQLMDSAKCRQHGQLHLIVQQIFAPLLELGILSSPQQEKESSKDNNRKLDLCANYLAQFLQTWPGCLSSFAMTKSENYGTFLHPQSCLRLIDHLGRNAISMRNFAKMHEVFVDFFCKLLYLPYATTVFSNWPDALQYYGRIGTPDSYRTSLREEFVLAELSFISSTKQTNCVDLLNVFRCVHVYALVNVGLIEALIRVILQNPDEQYALKATLLIADLNKITIAHLPRDMRLKALGIAELVSMAAQAFQQPIEPSKQYSTGEGAADVEMDWTLTASEAHRFAILLLDRLQQIGNLHANTKPRMETVHTFLLGDIGQFSDGDDDILWRKRSRGNSSLAGSGSRHGIELESGVARSASRDEAETAAVLIANLDELISKATVAECQTPPPSFTVGRHSPLPASQSVQSGLFSITGIGVGVPILAPPPSTIQHQISHEGYLQSRGQQYQWSVIWRIVHTVEVGLSAKLVDKCVPLLDKLVKYFLPSSQQFLQQEIDTLMVACAQRCFRLLCVCAVSSSIVGNDNSHWAAKQIASFLIDFCAQLQLVDKNVNGVFASKYLLNSGSRYYFAILRILASHPTGFKLLEQTSLNQLLFELVQNGETPTELAKLIITSMDYFPAGDGEGDEFSKNSSAIFARSLLETVLQSAPNEWLRRWTTLLLGGFLALAQLGHLPNFDWNWTIHLAFRQLSDPSPKIVRCASNLLLDWIPQCPVELRKDVLHLLQKTKLEIYGNLGILLEVFLYGDWDENVFSTRIPLAKKALREWKTKFNLSYVDIVEERLRNALLCTNEEIGTNSGSGTFQHRRSKDGNFARASSNTFNGNCSPSAVLCPDHLYGHLNRTVAGRQLLQSEAVIEDTIKILQKFLTGREEIEAKEVKAALLDLAHILANADPCQHYVFDGEPSCTIASLAQLILDSVAQQHSLIIRGYALWALNIAANGNQMVSDLITSLGWECGEGEQNEDDKPKNSKFTPKWGIKTMMPPPSTPTTDDYSASRQSRFTTMSSGGAGGAADPSEQRPRAFTEFPGNVQNATMTTKAMPKKPRSRRSASLSSNITTPSPHFELIRQQQQRLTVEQLQMDQQRWGQLSSLSSSDQSTGYGRRSRHSTVSQVQSKSNKMDRCESTTTESSRCRFMSDTEHDSLVAYRKFLVKAGEINEYEKINNGKNISVSDYPQKMVIHGHADRAKVFLHARIEHIFGNIVLEDDELSASHQIIDDYCPNASREHNKWYCVYCSGGIPYPGEREAIWSGEKRSELLGLVDQLANHQLGSPNSVIAKLLKLYRDDSELFSNSCLFSDALHIINGSKTMAFDVRCLIYQLFSRAI